METTTLMPLLDELQDNIDDLEEALGPLLKTNLSDITSKLPLLDRAKLHVLVTYGIESIIFAYLKLNGVDAREHPVFTELTRVKQYFEKIKQAENAGPMKRENVQLDKDAAGRFIKSALAGNDEYDRNRVDQRAKQKENAQKKFEASSADIGTAQRFKHLSKKRKADDDTTTPLTTTPSATSSRTSPTASATPDEAHLSAPPLIEDENHDRKENLKKRKKFPLSAVQDERQPSPRLKTFESPQVSFTTPEHRSESSEKKHKRHSKEERKRVKALSKSHTAPKSGNTVFQELLNKPALRGTDKG